MKIVALEPIHESQAVQTGVPLIEVLQLKKLNVLKSCGGHGLCATCHVHVRQGIESLSPMNERERRTLSFITGTDETSRLACQARVFGNTAVVYLPQGMYIEKAEDLLDLLGTRSPEDILHPIRGHVLIAKGKIITRTQIELLKSLREEVDKARQGNPSGATANAIDKLSEPVSQANNTQPKSNPPLNNLPNATVSLPVPPTAQPNPHAATPVVPSKLIKDINSPLHNETAATDKDKSKGADSAASIDRVVVSTRIVNSQTLATGSSISRSIRLPNKTASELAPAIGETLGKCVLQAKLGTGSTGIVYRAYHRSLGIPVAVKVLRLPQDCDSETVAAIRERLRAEAQLLAQINHPYIVRVWDFDDEHIFPYAVLELVDGPSLAELIQQSGRITVERTLALALQVAEALQVAYELGVVHRDVKPGNILVTREGKAKLADLGLARSRDANTSTAGTIAYMPPEQANSGEIDLRSDIYALGATMFHAVTGRLPFPGKTLQEVLYKHAHQPLDPLAQLVPGLPSGFTELINGMMAKNPNDRPQTYDELIADIKVILADLTNSAQQLPISHTTTLIRRSG